jgi:mono/diheme cytochrome c family protein
MRAILSSIGALLLAGTTLPGSAANGNAANGKRLYAAYGCYQCHGRQAQGSSATGPRLGPNPIAWAAFAPYVRQPSGQMPPYTSKAVPDAELADIFAFIQTIPQPAKTPEWRE